MNKYIGKITLIIVSLFFITNCSKVDIYANNDSFKKSKNNINNFKYNDYNESFDIQKSFDALKKNQENALLYGTLEEIDRVILENELLKSFEKWKGTKYVWGGDSHNGIDCSALTRRVYREVFNYELPRVSIDQANHGKKIPTSKLKAGDILFFRPEDRVNHTAVYLGNGLFINASTSKGVILSSLENNYWGKYFKYAVRIDRKNG